MLSKSSRAVAGDQLRRSSGNTDLASEIERLLSSGIGITARAIDQATEASELTLIQWRVLVIASQAKSLRIGELAARLGISIPSASRLVRRIETQGLVTATRANDDRRATNIELTKAGQDIVDAVVRRRREIIGLALRPQVGNVQAVGSHLIGQIADRLAGFA